jgi:hypothetical protein
LEAKIFSESDVGDLDNALLRNKILDVAKRFKTNWLDLAKHLYVVKRKKLFKEWGYIDFEGYCTREIAIKKQTAFKLLSTYYFLTHEEPRFLEEEIVQKDDPRTLPPFESIDILRKAKAKTKKDLSEDDYNQLKDAVLEKSIEPKEIGKQFRSMLKAVKDVDPEEERINKRVATIRRFVGTLRGLKKEIEVLKLFPDRILKDINNVIVSLESELEQFSNEE